MQLDIGITLRKYRDEYYYSQQFVADCLNISRVAYRNWENNKVIFNIEQLRKISELYGISIEIIISESYTAK